MKGVRFYLDHASAHDKRNGNGNGNVTAILASNGTYQAYPSNEACYDGIGAIFNTPNSDVASTGVSVQWLRDNGKRISETEARAIHPRLFQYLDN